MKQFGKILKFELKNQIMDKLFIGITVFLVVLICVVMSIPRITQLLEREDVPDGDKPVMLLSPDTDEVRSLAQSYFAAAFSQYDVRVSAEDTDKIKEQIVSGEAECAFLLDGLTSYTYCVNDLSMYDGNTAVADSILRDVYRLNAMLSGGMTQEQVEDAMNAVIEGKVENLGKDQTKNFFYTYAMIMALYMVILLYGQKVMTGIVSEKSSRAMELLITSASPTSMIFAKVLAACTAGLCQLVLIFGAAIVSFRVNREAWGENEIISSFFDIPPTLFLFLLFFFVLGFLLYAFLLGAVASTTSKPEDASTASTPVMILFVIGFMVVMFSMASGSVDGTLLKVCSYIPFTSPMAMFTRLAMSSVPPAGLIVSVLLLIASTLGIGVLSAKIYRAGVLMYGTPPKLGKILKTIRKA